MNRSTQRARLRMHAGVAVVALVAFAALAVLPGCGGMRENVRLSNYPPDFEYVTERRVDSGMWRMADQVRRLNEALRETDMSDSDRQAAVLSALDGIRSASVEVDDDAAITNHPMLDDHLPRLRDDLALARSAAAESLPRYALAGSVAGACVYCHDARVAPARE